MLCYAMCVTVNIIFIYFDIWHEIHRHTCLAPEGTKKSISGPRPKKVVHHCTILSVLMHIYISTCLHTYIHTCTLIHSVILETSIAPLQETTTERCSQPTQGQRRRTSERCKIWKGGPSEGTAEKFITYNKPFIPYQK